MKKKNLMPLAKSAFALSLAATMVVPTGIPTAAAKDMDADTEVTVPEPIKTIDFNRGLLGVAQDELKRTENIVGKSEELYVQKTAEEVGGTEKVDANGLVYTGDNTNARYHRQNVSNQPTTAWDEEKGTVLKIGKTQTIPAIYKSKSAGTEDEGVTKLLDEEIPYETSGTAATELGVLVQPEKTVSSEIIIDNPFGSQELRESLEEYSIYEAPDTSPGGRWTNKWNKSRYQPTWEKGLTFSYWIKVPSNEDGTYKRGSALRWELDHQLYYQADDYAKYLTCSYWDVERQELADKYYSGSLEALDTAAVKEESGTIYGSEYYYKYAETDGVDENGKPIPAIRQGATFSGPVYDHKFVRDTEGAHRSLYYQFNPNFVRGYVLLADGNYEEQNSNTEDAYYKNFHTLDMEAGSKVKRGYNDGELQIDTDNSIFWVPDNNQAININKNTSYGSKQGMHNGDVFFMNSWQGPTADTKDRITDAYGNGAYAGGNEFALSPVTSVEEDEKGNRVATPNGNVDKWHQVTVTLQNDWVEFWVDGEMVDVREYYSSRGVNTIDMSESFKRLNKGTGLRGGFGSEKTKLGNISYGNYVCRLLMDWMTDEDAKLHIGGAGQYAKEYAQAETSCDFSIDDLKFYDQLLTEEQIVKAYEDEVAAMNAPVNVTGTAVDITAVSDVSVGVEDAVKTGKVTIKGESVDSVSIAANPKQSTTTGARVANPFAGKNLEGATIGYWVKQDDADSSSSLLSFMDDEDIEIQSPKDGGAKAKSILYVKNNGEASYIDGYTSSSSASVKNTYVTATDATGAAAILQDSAKDWMYVTATMTNAGIKYYINGELVENMATDKAGVRFLDGYYSRLRDEENVQTKLGAFGGTNNQGTRTLMDFLTSTNTSIYFGYSITKGGMSCDRTSGCQFAAVKYVDAALTDEQVKTLYANSLGSEDVKLGDVDGDGEIKLKDAQLALKIALNLMAPTPEQEKAADVDKNEKVELKDAQAILKVALNLATGF